MRSRKRKETLLGDGHIKHVSSKVEYDPESVIKELTANEVDRKILRLKSDRLSERKSGPNLGLAAIK